MARPSCLRRPRRLAVSGSGAALASVNGQLVVVVHAAEIAHVDAEVAGPGRRPAAQHRVARVGVGADGVAVLVGDVQVEVGVAIAAAALGSGISNTFSKVVSSLG